MIYGYARVSTKGQAKDGNSLEAQEKALREKGAEKIYADSFTGTKMDRPQLNELLSVIGIGDTLIVTKIDRLARSLGQATELITELIDKGITVDVINVGVMSNDSVNVLMRNVLLAFAQFERDMIVQRTQEGKAIAKQNPSYREGRPPKYDEEKLKAAVALLDNHSYTQVIKLTGISKSTLIRAVKKYRNNK